MVENYKKYSIVKMIFFFFLNAGMEGEGGGFTCASWKRSWERGSESFVLIDYLSEQDRPILPNRDCPRRKNCLEDLQCLPFWDNVTNGVLKSGR